MKYENWQPFTMYCPNCGNRVTGYKNDEGVIKMDCGRCTTVLVRRFKSRRHETIDVYAPKGTERICV